MQEAASKRARKWDELVAKNTRLKAKLASLQVLNLEFSLLWYRVRMHLSWCTVGLCSLSATSRHC
jgi:hypothetical protein